MESVALGGKDECAGGDGRAARSRIAPHVIEIRGRSGMNAENIDHDNGAEYTVRARYLYGCDRGQAVLNPDGYHDQSAALCSILPRRGTVPQDYSTWHNSTASRSRGELTSAGERTTIPLQLRLGRIPQPSVMGSFNRPLLKRDRRHRTSARDAPPDRKPRLFQS